MKVYEIRGNQLAVILSMQEAKALLARTQQHTGVKKSQMLLRAEQKLATAIAFPKG
jgi:hypothetical protein